MKNLKLSIVCVFAMCAGIAASFTTKASASKAGSMNYYANENNIASPANSDLFSVSSEPISQCDNTSQQICGVESATPPSGGVLPNGATYTTVDLGTYSE